MRQEKLDAEDQNSYEEAFPEVHTGMADILVYFYARALQILGPGDGFHSSPATSSCEPATAPAYVSTFRIRCASASRRLGDLPLFEANGKTIAAYPAVLVGNRSEDLAEHALPVADLAGPVRKELSKARLKVGTESVRGVLEDLDGLLARAEVRDFPQVLLKKDGWIWMTQP